MQLPTTRSAHYMEVGGLAPQPIIIRRAGGGLGLTAEEATSFGGGSTTDQQSQSSRPTYKGDYLLAASGPDGVSTSLRVCHGSIPIDLVAKRDHHHHHHHHAQQQQSQNGNENSAPLSPQALARTARVQSPNKQHQHQSTRRPLSPKERLQRQQHMPNQTFSCVPLPGQGLPDNLDAPRPMSSGGRQRSTSPRSTNVTMRKSSNMMAASGSCSSGINNRAGRPTSPRNTSSYNNNNGAPTSARPRSSSGSSASSSTSSPRVHVATPTRKAIATPGTLRIMQGQLQNGMNVKTVVNRATQAAKDRIYRPRTDRVLAQEEADAKTKALATRLKQSAEHQVTIDDFYSPSRRHAGSAVPPDCVGGDSKNKNNNGQLAHPAVEFDPYALSLLSTLPPLSATTDPFISSRAELRRVHPLDSCPGAFVMHTALGHLRAVGAVPYLLDCTFGVYAVQRTMAEEEKLQAIEDSMFDILSSDSDNDDGTSSSSMTGGFTLSLSRKSLRHANMRSSGDGNGSSVSPSTAFRQTAMELLAPLEQRAEAAVEHPRDDDIARERLRHENEKRKEIRKQVRHVKGDDYNDEEVVHSGITVTIDGRAFSEPAQRCTRPKFRVFTIFCDRHPLPGLHHVCRVPFPTPKPQQWSPHDIIVCFGWRADADIDHTVEKVVGDGFFVNSGLKEHAWEPALLERRLVFQFFAPPSDAEGGDFHNEQQGHYSNMRKASSPSAGAGGGINNNLPTALRGSINRHDSHRGGGGDFDFNRSSAPEGSRHRPFRVHDFEMHSAAEAGYQVFSWENFSHEFSRAIGEAFLRSI